jgi:trimethylamine:corrinoid methyltransferase-like protein
MNEEKIIDMLLKHDADIAYIKENMATKQDLRAISDTLDTLVTLAKKKDQEFTMQGESIKRLRDDVDMIKPLVGLPV